jgi:hypothetical protein
MKATVVFLLSQALFIMCVSASTPPTRVGFRFENVSNGLSILRPIYPVKFGARQVSGERPKADDLLTCDVSLDTTKLHDDKGVEYKMQQMVFTCKDGKTFKVIGIAW